MTVSAPETPVPERPPIRTFADFEAVMAAELPGYTSRPAQQALAAFIEQLSADCKPVLDEKGKVKEPGKALQAMAEAGTGTGKSLGALIPSILSEVLRSGRVVISTSTIALMNQYLDKDLPWLQAVFGRHGVQFTYAPLKGLGQYACLSKLNDATPDQVGNLADLLVELTAEGSESTGDKDKILTQVATAEWPLVSSSSDECPGKSSCAFGDRCFGYQAKARAADASLLITNAKMAMLDTALTMQARENDQKGNADSFLIGRRTLMIFDEGHELPEIAADTLGFDLREGGITRFAEQAATFVNTHSGAKADADTIRQHIDARVQQLSVILTKIIEDSGEKTPTLDVEFVKEHLRVFEVLIEKINLMWNQLSKAEIDKRFKDNESTKKKRLQKTAENLLRSLSKILEASELDMVAWPEMEEKKIRGGEETVTRWVLKARPIEVGPILQEELWSRYPAVILSATLSSGGGDFTYMAKTLGLNGARTLDVGTPFDYPRQSLLYVPDASWPSPAGGTSKAAREERALWQTKAIETALHMVREGSKGGAMLLFTSKTDMLAAYKVMEPRLRSSKFPCYLQGGELSNKEIAARFKTEEDSVLFGMKSFFVGVDFPGRTNRLVIMMKLPFPVPSDPLYAARAKKIEERTGDTWASFKQLMIPMATLTLHQGYGRLIRHADDYGVVAIFDPRLTTKEYGREIVRNLPPSPYTTEVSHVLAYFDGWRQAEAA